MSTFRYAYRVTDQEVEEVLQGKKTAMMFPVFPTQNNDITEWFSHEDVFYGYIKQKYGQETEVTCPFGRTGSCFSMTGDAAAVTVETASVEIVRLRALIENDARIDKAATLFPEQEVLAEIDFGEQDWFWLVSFTNAAGELGGAA